MPYLNRHDAALDFRWSLLNAEGWHWHLFVSDPPIDDEYDGLASERDPDATKVYIVSDSEVEHLVKTFTADAKEVDLLAWLETRKGESDTCAEDDGPQTVGGAIDACWDILNGFCEVQTRAILAALHAAFGEEE